MPIDIVMSIQIMQEKYPFLFFESFTCANSNQQGFVWIPGKFEASFSVDQD